VFDKVMTGDFDTAKFVAALGRAGAEHRLLVWNSDENEQAVLDGTALQGAFAQNTDSDTTDFGVFVNDGGGAKMDYYMVFGADATWCAAGEADLTVTLRNNAPADVSSLPEYLTADGYYGVAAGNVETVAYIYLPEGATLLSTSTSGDGASSGIGGGMDGDRQVIPWTTLLEPAQELTLRVRVQTPPTDRIVTRTTPTINGNDTPIVASSCGSAG